MTRTPIDPYATLGVGREATLAQIAHAYRRLAKELHPDLGGEPRGGLMRELNAAWEILSDPAKRAAWDRGQGVVAVGTHRTPAVPGTRPVHNQRWAEWPADRPGRPGAAYPSRPRPAERRRSDSPWLAGAVGAAIVVVVLFVAGLFSLGGTRNLADGFEGFQAQVPAPFLNRAVAGTAIRITFGMDGFQGNDLLADGLPTSSSYPCEDGANGPADIQAAADASRSSLVYAPAAHAYIYTWKTDASWAGTCRELTFTFRDRSSRSGLFDFRPAAS